jgi:hypothetical protein
MSQKIDIGDYVNLNLDQNDMATSLNNLHNEHYENQERGSQIMDNLIDEIENIPHTQPQMMMQQQHQMMQQPQQMMMQQPQQQMMMQQPQQQMMMQQQPQMNLYKDVESEKTKILKELDMIDSEKSDIKNNNLELTEKELFETKSFTSHIKETFLVILLYIIIGNDYINEYITKYIPYLSETPSILLAIKVILMGLLFHTIRYFMNR